MTDPHLWLEDIDGERQLAWVEEHNQRTLADLDPEPSYRETFDRAVRLITADDRIDHASKRGDHAFNFWTDATNPRGLLRRTPFDSYLSGDPDWEVLLDIDELARAEGENWTLSSTTVRQPELDRALIALADGGSDTHITREFDLTSKTFVDGGFSVPACKGSVTWIDLDTVIVAADWGPDSLTASGYPRSVRLLRRGTAFQEAEPLFECPHDHVMVSVEAFEAGGRRVPYIHQRPRFFQDRFHVLLDDELVTIDIPDDALASMACGHLVVRLRTDWKGFSAGSLIAAPFDDAVRGAADYQALYEPDDRSALEAFTATRDTVIVNTLTDVQTRLDRYRVVDGAWEHEPIDIPASTTATVTFASKADDTFFFIADGFTTPTTLHYADPAPRAVRSAPHRFEASDLDTEQHWATSADGTRIPYFVVRRPGTGPSPTLLTAYGGFEVSRVPEYRAMDGAAWLEHGGTFVLANLRGGGEFGPRWHDSVLKENRQRVYEDFFAVSEDLIERGITTAAQLGIQGGSNGGLLTGVAMTQRPDLYGAVIIAVPLLDMKRYHKLLAGASWMAEYGDPDVPEEWAFISKYSPYQNVSPDADYPPVLIWTTTRDDRVHPGHARKMAALLEEIGHDVLYYENTEGGHGIGVTPDQQATVHAIQYSFLRRHLF